MHTVDRLIVRSNFLRSTYITAGAPAEKIIFSRQGLDFPAFHPEVENKNANRPLRVGYLGQIA